MAEIFNGVKLGTCEHLMYVSRKEIEKKVSENYGLLNKSEGNLVNLKDYLDLECNWIYRFPFEDELNSKWENINTRYERTFKITGIDPSKIAIPHNNFIQTSINGKTYNLPFCPVSEDAEKLGVKKINHWGIDVNIVGERYNKENPNGYTLLECSSCGKWFVLDEEEAEYLIERLKSKGYEYEANLIKFKNVGDM